MTNYREILRLQALGMNKQETAASIGCSRNTVAEVLRRSKELKLSYPLPDEMTDAKLATLLYPSATSKPIYKMPDYEYVAKEKVDVRITRSIVEVFFGGNRICSHTRLYGRQNQYSTTESHMPEKHQQYAQWNGDRFRSWADKIGIETKTVVSAILSGYKVEQQGYKACMGILRLADKYTPERLERACRKALTFTPRPSLKNIQAILASGQDSSEETVESTTSSKYGFTRGAEYYGGKK